MQRAVWEVCSGELGVRGGGGAAMVGWMRLKSVMGGAAGGPKLWIVG